MAKEAIDTPIDLPPVALEDGELSDPDEGKSEEARAQIERKLLWRLDLTLIPWLCLLYLLAFLDRANMGNAKVAGLVTDLHLSTGQFNATLSIFFVSYSIFEPLTNILLKRMRPSVFLPIIMLMYGVTTIGMGFVNNFAGLMTARFFLGLAEAGLFPGINYYLSCWYKRSEFGIRAAVFFSGAAISGSFGGLLAAAIEQMDGVGGRPGWAWLFIIVGLLTIFVGLLSFWVVSDFPSDAKFLSPEDKARVLHRLRADKQGSAEKEAFHMGHVWSAVRDWKTWLGMAVYMGTTVPLYAFSLFLPSIVRGLGWSTTVVSAQLYSVAPYVSAAVITVLVGFLADRMNTRGIFNIVCSIIGAAGFSMLLASTQPAVQYAGTFLGAIGIYPCVSNTITWMANNVEGVYRRGVILGFVIGWGNLNGIVSANIYYSPPRYIEGHAIVLAFLLTFLFGGSLLMTALLQLENRRRKLGQRNLWVEGKTPAEIRDLGDWNPEFVYTT